jgi:GNAT superfamily N-acetyltransferase
MTHSVSIRQGVASDIPAIHDLVVELALYEKEPDAVTASQATYSRDFEAGCFRTLVAEQSDEIVGLALYYPTYSTWKGRMLHLEDFIVKDTYRRHGIGKLLFRAFLDQAEELGCILTRWQVLDWNDPAINFYEKIGATIEKNWWNGKLYLSDRTLI